MKRIPTIVVLLAVLAGGVFARGAEDTAPSGPGELPVLSVLYPKAVASVPLLMVLETYPEDYRGEFFTDHPQALARLITGDVDLLTTGFSVGLNRYSAAGDLVHLVTPVWSVSALMTSEPLNTLDELDGGTVYSPFEGSPIDIYLNSIFAQAGLDGSVEIAYAPFPQSAALLAQKKIEAAVLVEPLASKLEIQGAAYRYENLDEGWSRVTGGEPRSPQVSLFTTAAGFEEYPEALNLFVDRYIDAVRTVAADPAEAAERFSEDLGFPVPVVQRALENTRFEVPSPEVTKEIIDSYAAVMGLDPPGSDFYSEMR